MRKLSIFAALFICGFAAILSAQDNRVFDWTPANSETIPLEPASLHSGRIYRPAAGGGKGAEQQRGGDGKVPHTTSICPFTTVYLDNSGAKDYGSTGYSWRWVMRRDIGFCRHKRSK